MTCRERRSWTEEEDELLRDAVKREDPDGNPPSKWHQISKHVPNRTNKDCRKRWFAKMASIVAKGGWSADEDERLIEAVRKYGTKWSLVAGVVQTRNNDQCAKRWSDTLNPEIDRTVWSPEEDTQLLEAVEAMGKSWTKIVKTYFPGRTGLSAKNRYSRLIRIGSDPNKGTRTRRRSVSNTPYTRHRSPTSASSSSENTSSISPAIDPMFPCIADVPEFSPLGSVSSSTLEDLHFRRSLATETPETIPTSGFVNSSAPEYLNMAASQMANPSPTRASSLDALMSELSASAAFDHPSTSTPSQFRNHRSRVSTHPSFSGSNMMLDPQRVQVPWHTGDSGPHALFPDQPYSFPFPIDDFPSSLPMTSSPSSIASISTTPGPPTPSSLGMLSPTTQSPRTTGQQYVGSDDLMAMLQACDDVSQYQSNNYFNGQTVQPSRNDSRRSISAAGPVRESQEFPATVQSFVNGFWGNMCTPTRLPNSP